MSIEIQDVKARHPKLYMLFTILPGLLTTSLLVVMIAGYGSFLLDDGKKYSILFIIALHIAIVYFMRWLIRGFEYALFTILAIIQLKHHQATDFNTILFQKSSLSRKDTIFIKKLPDDLHARDLLHWVILPMYNETASLVRETLISLSRSDYDLSRLAITIAGEERKKEHFLSVIDAVMSEFQDVFGLLTYTVHPMNVPGEMVGKGANITYAAKEQYAYICEHFAVSPHQVMVTTLDADTNVSPQYFALMSYTYLTQPDRKYKSYQPMIFFFNNFREVPFFSKMVSMGNSFWVMFNAVKKYGTRNFSTHMQPLDALIELDFWSIQTIVEDGHQFWRSYFGFKGRYECVPVYTTVYQDANNNETMLSTAVAQYTQMRRWSHGAEDIAYSLCMWIDQRKELSFLRTLYERVRMVEGILLWSTLHLVLLGGIGFSLIKDVDINTYISLGKFVDICMKFSYVIMTIVICMQLLFCPWQKLTKIQIVKELLRFMVLYIPLIGFILVIFSGAPAFHTQFALMINKPMKKFSVTEKVRKGVVLSLCLLGSYICTTSIFAQSSIDDDEPETPTTQTSEPQQDLRTIPLNIVYTQQKNPPTSMLWIGILLFCCLAFVWRNHHKKKQQKVPTSMISDIYTQPSIQTKIVAWHEQLPDDSDLLYAESLEHLLRNYLQAQRGVNIYNLTYSELLQLNNHQTGSKRVPMEPLRRVCMHLQKARYAEQGSDKAGMRKEMLEIFG